ncbi:MAG: TIGR00730 family Rossman fold protein [Planctomycetia bacterium]|nr:TIGR00730 family Rossman fold protein [Planctomycetia bacterium]
MRIKSLCVFCGSSSGNAPEYAIAAAAFGRLAAERGIELIYGGGRVGLMGAVADACLSSGGRVVGVIPEALATKELAHQGCTELHVVGSMHERKALMAERSDGFVALPGGIGTLEELFEVWTWGQLGLHEKPCGLLNIAGFFDKLLEFLNATAADGFMHQEHLAMLTTATDGSELIEHFENYQPPDVRKWLRWESEK